MNYPKNERPEWMSVKEWEQKEPSSQYALPQCGHVRGMYWNGSAWVCTICNKPKQEKKA